jgi:hypothetical protein
MTTPGERPEIALSPDTEAALLALLDSVQQASAELRDLPLPLRYAFVIGYEQGRDSLRPEVDYQRAAADRYYSIAFNPPGFDRLLTRQVRA